MCGSQKVIYAKSESMTEKPMTIRIMEREMYRITTHTERTKIGRINATGDVRLINLAPCSLQEHDKISRSHFIDLLFCNKWVSYHPDKNRTINGRSFNGRAFSPFRWKNIKSKKGNAPVRIVHRVQFTFPNFGRTMGALGKQWHNIASISFAAWPHSTTKQTLLTFMSHDRTVRTTISSEFHLAYERIGMRWRMAFAFFLSLSREILPS